LQHAGAQRVHLFPGAPAWSGVCLQLVQTILVIDLLVCARYWRGGRGKDADAAASVRASARPLGAAICSDGGVGAVCVISGAGAVDPESRSRR
jgi:hypothetical protein